MGFRVIGKNAVVTVVLGGVQDGTAPDYTGTAISLIARAKTIKLEKTASTADMSTLGDDVDVVQVTRTGSKVTFDLEVGDGGFQFEEAVGQYAKVTAKSNSTLSAGTVYEGVVTAWNADFPDGAQIESITVTCGANGTTLTP